MICIGRNSLGIFDKNHGVVLHSWHFRGHGCVGCWAVFLRWLFIAASRFLLALALFFLRVVWVQVAIDLGLFGVKSVLSHDRIHAG